MLRTGAKRRRRVFRGSTVVAVVLASLGLGAVGAGAAPGPVAVPAARSASGVTGFIVGGDPVAPGEFPALAAIMVDEPHIPARERLLCSGTVVAPRWILTAGHCSIEVLIGEPLVVQVGARDLGAHRRADGRDQPRGRPREVLQPRCRLRRRSHAHRGDGHGPDGPARHERRLGPRGRWPPGDGGGMGPDQAARDRAVARVQRQAATPCPPPSTSRSSTTPPAPRRSRTSRPATSSPRAMSAPAGPARTSCYGDSGGPLYARDPQGALVQIGITSRGAGCATKLFPGIFTDVERVGAVDPPVHDPAVHEPGQALAGPGLPRRAGPERAPLRLLSRLVGEGGLEPPHPFGHRHLKPARLPIPPLARVE